MASIDPTDPKPRPPSASVAALIPVGAWIQLELPERPSVVGFTYIDRQAGFSAHGWQTDGSRLDESSRITIRLPMPRAPWRRLSPEEVRQFGLETPPSW